MTYDYAAFWRAMKSGQKLRLEGGEVAVFRHLITDDEILQPVICTRSNTVISRNTYGSCGPGSSSIIATIEEDVTLPECWVQRMADGFVWIHNQKPADTRGGDITHIPAKTITRDVPLPWLKDDTK